MTVLAIAAAGVAAMVHVLFFLVESVWFTNPRVHSRFGASGEDAEVLRPMAFNQGFYNLFLAAGAAAGAGALGIGAATVGRTLLLYACACMVLAAVVLFLTDRRYVLGSLLQATPALVAVLAASLA